MTLCINLIDSYVLIHIDPIKLCINLIGSMYIHGNRPFPNSVMF